eukprot:TRINITY_DN49522_c0_g2_i1.p1 TRINITY_DN49522_c0_g2~~TRINITY_DN49522_c0_g2_i1.p1  ORF type:complete len:109 (+),score=12.73 TRINITY_DN49522_c0_g2_i1:42-329(+)
MPGCCNLTGADRWLQFLEGVWQIDDCCAGVAPPWAFCLQFRGGNLTYQAGDAGLIAVICGMWHLEGAPLTWISNSLIARYSQAGDHFIWSRQPAA